MIDLPVTYAPVRIRMVRLIELIDESVRPFILKAFEEIWGDEALRTAKGSSHNHQAWDGGYLDHVAEGMHIAVRQYEALNRVRHLPFTLSDALIVFFMHDIEKPWKYGKNYSFSNKQERHDFRMWTAWRYCIDLTEDQVNAIKYVEGELDDYSSTERVMGPLAAFCHSCDVLSARLWFDQPRADCMHVAQEQCVAP